jgi:hypothetical protein
LYHQNNIYMVSSRQHEAPRYALPSTPPVISSLLGQNIFLTTLFSNTLSLCSPQCTKPSYTLVSNRQNYSLYT